MYGRSWVVGASDRMLTSGIVEFEPPREKLVWLHHSVVAMVAGDVSIQTGILNSVSERIAHRKLKKPPTVQWVAEIYGQLAMADRDSRAEADVLRPRGLTHKEFIKWQSKLNRAFVTQVDLELMGFAEKFERDVGCIIAGTDSVGAHIYVGQPGPPRCEDSVGFAAVGTGDWHADSYLMLQKHTPAIEAPAAMVAVYFAKKRGESAPGVGEATDMFLIGPDGIRGASNADSSMVRQLDRIYGRERKAAARADQRARQEMVRHFEEIRGRTGRRRAIAAMRTGYSPKPST